MLDLVICAVCLAVRDYSVIIIRMCKAYFVTHPSQACPKASEAACCHHLSLALSPLASRLTFSSNILTVRGPLQPFSNRAGFGRNIVGPLPQLMMPPIGMLPETARPWGRSGQPHAACRASASGTNLVLRRMVRGGGNPLGRGRRVEGPAIP